MTPTEFHDGRVTLWPGDCLEALAVMPENSIDSCVTDPPYHLQSIVKRFAKTGRTDKTRTSSGPHQRTASGFMNKQWDGGDVAFKKETWESICRVLKPGAYLLAFSGTRTYHRMACAIEDAGFVIYDQIGWAYGSGFPKNHNIGKKVSGWEGWGTALKPAWEPICVARKPVEGTIAENVLKWGAGAINIDGCRVATELPRPHIESRADASLDGEIYGSGVNGSKNVGVTTEGRWPANIIHDGSEEVVAAFPDARSSGDYPSNGGSKTEGWGNIGTAHGAIYSDAGSAARFFYTAKADSDDRLGSKHPTVKPLDLIQYLVRLVTRKDGVTLDPFAGTGTTGEAALREGARAVLIEREPEYQADITRRMALAGAGAATRKIESIKAKGKVETDPGPLFASGEAA